MTKGEPASRLTPENAQAVKDQFGPIRETCPPYRQSGRLINGFDYDRQAWVKDGRYVRCGHPEEMNCKCFGRLYEGEETPTPEKTLVFLYRLSIPETAYDSFHRVALDRSTGNVSGSEVFEDALNDLLRRCYGPDAKAQFWSLEETEPKPDEGEETKP